MNNTRGDLVKKPLLSVLLTFMLAASLAIAVQTDEAEAKPMLGDRGVVVKITRVVDGDTVEINRSIDGENTVRLIGVDTPEVYGDREPYGPAASSFSTRRLEGRRVALQFDREREDRYGRLLAYVWRTPTSMFNVVLTSRGYGQVAIYQPNDRHETKLRKAQSRAKNNDRGLWGMTQRRQCKIANHGNGTGEGRPVCDRFEGGSGSGTEPGVAPVSESNCPSSHRIKGNIAGDGEKIYHMPSGAYYAVTNPERCFSTRTQAESAGYRASKR